MDLDGQRSPLFQVFFWVEEALKAFALAAGLASLHKGIVQGVFTTVLHCNITLTGEVKTSRTIAKGRRGVKLRDLTDCHVSPKLKGRAEPCKALEATRLGVCHFDDPAG
jgi:hypothetical protein